MEFEEVGRQHSLGGGARPGRPSQVDTARSSRGRRKGAGGEERGSGGEGWEWRGPEEERDWGSAPAAKGWRLGTCEAATFFPVCTEKKGKVLF
jgi:hypothetical protein